MELIIIIIAIVIALHTKGKSNNTTTNKGLSNYEKFDTFKKFNKK